MRGRRDGSSTGDADAPLYAIDVACERLRAARAAIDATGTNVVLTARAENFVAGRPDLDDTLRRLRAYAEAGADCLYAPGLATREQIAAVVGAVAPRPVNVLCSGATPLAVRDLATLGVRRISVGSGLARVAWAGFAAAAERIAREGRFDGLAGAMPGSTYVNDFNLFGRTFQVRAQAEGGFRADEHDIARLRTRNATGNMVPLGASTSSGGAARTASCATTCSPPPR
jgi:2-methylisocitrate lyase-like PEP mutase family enzyme